MTQVGLVTHGDADLLDFLYEEIFIGKYGIPCHLMSPVTLVSLICTLLLGQPRYSYLWDRLRDGRSSKVCLKNGGTQHKGQGEIVDAGKDAEDVVPSAPPSPSIKDQQLRRDGNEDGKAEGTDAVSAPVPKTNPSNSLNFKKNVDRRDSGDGRDRNFDTPSGSESAPEDGWEEI